MSRTVDELTATALTRLDALYQQSGAVKLYALLSGGYDSLVTTHLTAQHPAFAGVVHIDTTIGIPETQAYVRATCAQYGWPLTVLTPPVHYVQLVVRYGFPGAAAHTYMYRNLKDKPLMAFVQQARPLVPTRREGVFKRTGRIAFASGVRQQESDIRMGKRLDFYSEDRYPVDWLGVIFDWSARDVTEYRRAHALPRNRVKDLMHISGECLCGSFAKPYERYELGLYFPATAAKIDALEQMVRLSAEAGWSNPDLRTVNLQWGNAGSTPAGQVDFLPLCHACRGDEIPEAAA